MFVRFTDFFRIAILSVVFLCAVSAQGQDGEWTRSEEEIYEEAIAAYEKAKSGQPVIYFGHENYEYWSSPRLADLLQRMIRDPRMHEDTVTAAVGEYSHKSPPDDFILDYLKTATGKRRTVLIRGLLHAGNSERFKLVDFLKKHARTEADQGLRDDIVERLSGVVGFDEFISFCRANNIPVKESTVFRSYADLKGLAYLFETSLKTRPTPDLRDPKSAGQFFGVSYQIYHILKKHMEIVFPQPYLERMSQRDLRYLRNGILASYGKQFQSKILQNYYYGQFNYVTGFCRSNQCAPKDVKKRAFNESDLTDADKKNLDTILAIETARKRAGYDEPDLFVENFDYQAFMNGKADNFTLAPKDVHGLYQIKVDWERKTVWVWDKFGVSGWKLDTGKRIKFIHRAKGPLGFHPGRRLLAYQLNGTIRIEELDTGKILFTEKVSDWLKQYPVWAVNLFSPDGTRFVFSPSRLKFVAIHIPSGERKEYQIMKNVEFSALYRSMHNPTNEVVISPDGNHIFAIGYMSYDSTKWFIDIPLASQEGIRYLKMPKDILGGTMAFDEAGKNLYVVPGAKYNITAFSFEQIMRNGESMPAPVSIISPGATDTGAVYTADMYRDVLLTNSGRLFWRKVSDARGNTQPLAKYYGNSFDLDRKNGLFAWGNELGFVVLQRFPIEFN